MATNFIPLPKDSNAMTTARHQVKRTYGSQGAKPRITCRSSTSDTTSRSDESETTIRRKRPLADLFPNGSPPKKLKTEKPLGKHARKHEKKDPGLTQLHFCIDQSILRTCTLCGLSYTRGAADDENLHKTHCARVQRGMEWGREEEKEIRKEGGTAVIVDEDVTIGKGERGRIVAVKPSATGRIGCKVSGYLNTVNLALSAPDVPPSALESCKVYLFLLRTPRCIKEKIVGCVVAQRISSAMQIASREEVANLENASETLVHVEGDLYCHPDDLPTPMGIPRLFVSSAHRRKGIAHALLTAAARTFVHGYRLDAAKGEIAFSQPTSAGRAVMEKWGNGGVRVYKE